MAVTAFDPPCPKKPHAARKLRGSLIIADRSFTFREWEFSTFLAPVTLTLTSGESKPERTGTPFRGPVETTESVPGPQYVNIRTGTVVPGPH